MNDLNGDGKVNGADSSLFHNEIDKGSSGGSSNGGCSGGGCLGFSVLGAIEIGFIVLWIIYEISKDFL